MTLPYSLILSVAKDLEFIFRIRSRTRYLLSNGGRNEETQQTRQTQQTQ